MQVGFILILAHLRLMHLCLFAANQLDDLITTVANGTKCPCLGFFCQQDPRGYRIAVALVPKMRWDIEAEGKERP